MLKKGCDAYLAYMKEAKKESPRVEDIWIVREYPNVFPDELPGLPPEREVEFTIKLVSSTEPISISPYRTALAEL